MTVRKRGAGSTWLGLLILAALVTVLVGLLLPLDYVQLLLALVYAPESYDLSDPVLLANWRWVLGASAGLVVLVLALLLWSLRHAARRRRELRQTPAARFARAVQSGNTDQIVELADLLARTGGAGEIDLLRDALEHTQKEPARQAVAAALYRLGRAVTAEVSPRPLRR